MSKRKKIRKNPANISHAPSLEKPHGEAIGVPTPIRFQVSTPEGGEIEMVILEALEKIPASMRDSVNVGALFRKVMIGNDAEIAAMLRESLEGDGQ